MYLGTRPLGLRQGKFEPQQIAKFLEALAIGSRRGKRFSCKDVVNIDARSDAAHPLRNELDKISDAPPICRARRTTKRLRPLCGDIRREGRQCQRYRCEACMGARNAYRLVRTGEISRRRPGINTRVNKLVKRDHDEENIQPQRDARVHCRQQFAQSQNFEVVNKSDFRNGLRAMAFRQSKHRGYRDRRPPPPGRWGWVAKSIPGWIPEGAGSNARRPHRIPDWPIRAHDKPVRSRNTERPISNG